MKRILAVCMLLVAVATGAELKPRVVVLTDLKRFQETDDSESLVRLLAHADLVQIEGIIVSSGANYWDPSHALQGYRYVWEVLRAYEKSVGNLMQMSDQRDFETVEAQQPIGYWPSPHYLYQHTALGTPMQGLDQTGPERDNDGSRLIMAAVDKTDPRPVYILFWGGGNVLAQTLRDVSENPATQRTPAAVAAFVSKIRVVAIGDQDQPWIKRREPPVPNNSGQWMRRQFPAMHWTWLGGGPWGKSSRERQAFYQTHIQGHGPLGDAYPDHSNAVEGDSTALFHVLPLGFGDPEHPEWGTLAGVFVKGLHRSAGVTVYLDQPAGRDDVRAVSENLQARAVDAMWNSLAARMDWVRSGTGNRPPQIVVNGDRSAGMLVREAAVGDTLEFDASATKDAENDKLTYAWEQLPIPDSFGTGIALGGAHTPKATLTIPAGAAGKLIHFLLTVTDDGAGHHLTAWKRVLIRVRA